MRAVSFVNRVQWDVPGNIFRHGIAIGDVDNDGDNELVVGTSEGELYIFKGSEIWHKTTGLGFITCVAIGDIFNYGRNALVVICGDGWVHIFYSPRSVNPGTNVTATSSSTTTKDIPENQKAGGNDHDQFVRSNDTTTDHLSGKIECVHLQRIPPNTKVILIADVDCDGANEMIIGLTDRVVRSYRWSSNTDLGTGKLVGLNKWECANQIGTVTLQHRDDGTATLLVAQPGGTFMRIKCNANDCCSDEDSDTKSEAAANCVDYQTLGISRMRNPNISTEIIGNLEPGAGAEYLIAHESPSKFISKDNMAKSNLGNASKIDPKNFKSGSLEFQRNRSQPEIRKRSLDESYDRGKRDFVSMNREQHESMKFFSQFNSPEIDQVDGNFIGGNVILGDYPNRDNSKKSVLPTYKDFSSEQRIESEEKNIKSQTEMESNKSNETEENLMQTKPYALATLDGTIMLVKDEIILWAMQVDHQIFALSSLDVTDNGADEIIACAWDGHTYILDQQRRSVRFQFEEPVRSFCTGKYSLIPGTSTPSLVYATFNNKIFLYYDVILPSLTIKQFEPNDIMTLKQKNFIDELIGDCTDTERVKKMQQLTEYLLYGMEMSDDDVESDDKIQ
ncbi:hypothetical protein PV326_012298 [Microctonus aethiopoides]|nr:hypothetical protein PV326_012298 [Microctonus aethiopoides]